jgi:hypothetical protein
MLTTSLERLMADIAMVQQVPESLQWHPVPAVTSEFETEFYP